MASRYRQQGQPGARRLWAIPWWSSRILMSRDEMENIPDTGHDIGWGSKSWDREQSDDLGCRVLSFFFQSVVMKNVKHIPKRENELNALLWAVTLLQQWSSFWLCRARPRRLDWNQRVQDSNGESLESCEQQVVKAGVGGVRKIPKPCERCSS